MGMEIPETKKAEGEVATPEQTSEQKVMHAKKSVPVDKLPEENGGKKDVEAVENSKPPTDAVDEWPEPKKIHSFYIVKYRSFEDPNLKKKIESADKEIQKRSQARFEITEALRTKKSARAAIIDQLRPLNDENKRYKEILGEKRKEREPLQASLDELRNVISSGRNVGSSKEELDALIKSLKFRHNHETIPLDEEKRLMREIQSLEEASRRMVTNAPMIAKQEAIKDKVKLIGSDMDGVRKEQQQVWAKIVRLQDELNPINDEITSLEEELKSISEKRDKAFESLLELKKAREEGNSSYYRNRSLLNSSRDLAAKKNTSALEELCHTEVEAFMSKWCNSKAIREDYEKRILSSLDNRQLSRDGRMRNPDEKPILVQASQASEPETTSIKANAKQTKGDTKSVAQPVVVSVKKSEAKVSSELTVEKKEKVVEEAEDEYAAKPIKDLPKPKEIDAAHLKEMKRLEEIEKAKLARERKQRQAEKAAAKAGARAQKEAEKKSKEKEKKARKKVGACLPEASEELDGTDDKTIEVDASAGIDDHIADSVKAPAKPKEVKENFRSTNLSKNKTNIPKVILKRKKSQTYWYWATAGTSLAVLLVAIGCYFSFARN